jgi:hypothetical protein
MLKLKQAGFFKRVLFLEPPPIRENVPSSISVVGHQRKEAKPSPARIRTHVLTSPSWVQIRVFGQQTGWVN